MYPHSNEEGNQLLERHSDGQQQRVGVILTETSYKKRQNGNNEVIKSICYMTIFAVFAVVALFWILSTSTLSQEGLNSNEKILQQKRDPQTRKKSGHISNVGSVDQEQDFAIQIRQKPQPSSPSQVPKQFLPNTVNPSNNPWLQQIDSPIKQKYFLKVPVKKMLQLSSPDKFFGKSLTRQMSGMSFDQLQFGLNLLYVVHNVNFNGQVDVELAPYESDKKQKQEWINKLLQVQKQIYQQKYDISQYMDEQLPFCIVTPSYNNVQSKLYLRNIDSIFMQQYSNYHLVYIDDASPDKTGQYVLKYAQQKNIPKEKLTVIINEKNVFALENIVNAIHNHCNKGEIVMLIDGDDALIGRQVFSLYNAIYQRTESAFVYSNYLQVMYNEKAVIGASSRAIPPQLLQRHGGVRNQHAFLTSHLLSFYVDLFKMIKKEDLTYQNGTFYKYAYDVAMCTPMIQMASDRVFYLPELTYEYRFDTGQNDPGSGQHQVTSIIFEKPVYQQLKQFPFIDERENYLKEIQKEKKNLKI